MKIFPILTGSLKDPPDFLPANIGAIKKPLSRDKFFRIVYVFLTDIIFLVIDTFFQNRYHMITMLKTQKKHKGRNSSWVKKKKSRVLTAVS